VREVAGKSSWVETSALARRHERLAGVPLLRWSRPAAAGFDEGEPPHPEVWLLVEWPPGEKEPTKYFLCDLPEHYTLRRLVRIVKGRWKIEQDYQQLKEELGWTITKAAMGRAGTIMSPWLCWRMPS